MQLTSNHTAFENGTQNFAQNWTLDATGNWNEFKQGSVQGTWSIDQDRAHDAANQVGVISGSGGDWANAEHDKAGNMTIMLDGVDPANYKLRCTYDAWNRLVTVERLPNGESTGWVLVAEYSYLCPCQLAGTDFFRPGAPRGRRGIGRLSLAHNATAA